MTQKNGDRPSISKVYDLVETKFNRLEDKIDKILDSHAQKIDKLEDGQAKMFGGLALLGVIWAWIANNLFK